MFNFTIKFVGRNKGAIGISSRFVKTVQAEDFEAARLALYETYEHIHVESHTKERPIGFNIREGVNRVSYHPEWDSVKPWASYRNGTTGLHFETEEQAVEWLRAQ